MRPMMMGALTRLSMNAMGLIFAAVSLSSLPLFVQANENDAKSMLSGMSSAMRSLNYEGTFVQIRDGHTELMHILHANDENGISERMRSLNGEPREVIRNNSTVIGILPSTGNVIANDVKPIALQSPIKSDFMAGTNYKVMQNGEARVAGINADVIEVLPTDDFRYGYRFWIDQTNGMMLRSMVIDADNQPVEELMFTDIKYLDKVDPERFSVGVNQKTTQWVDAKTDIGDDSKPEVNKVSFQSLPSGYKERSETLRMISISEDAPISHVVVSDGFSTVSVYVEYIERAAHDASSLGLTHMGAVNAFGLSLPDALVTVVGEAPRKTVEMIARAARLVN